MLLKRVLETCLYTNDLPKTKEFYVGLLGIKFYSEAPGRHVFLKMPDGAMLLFFDPKETAKTGETLPVHFASGNQHVAFEVPKEEYAAWKERLQGASIPIAHEQTWKKGARSFYFRDPNGHLLEICEPGIWDRLG